MAIIEVKKVNKIYNKKQVLKDINNASRFIRSELMRRKIEIRNI